MSILDKLIQFTQHKLNYSKFIIQCKMEDFFYLLEFHILNYILYTDFFIFCSPIFDVVRSCTGN